jgi:agmatine deiminase
MITDQQTNTVYFSNLLRTDIRYLEECNCIIAILEKYQIKYHFLQFTKDVWCRDYMPVQISIDSFLQYNYNPDYLKPKKYRSQRTDPDNVNSILGLRTIQSDLILDGGNIIKSKNSLILTDKILTENKEYSKDQLIEKLKITFNVDRIILIPWDEENDIYGHADGMIRFLNEETVLINGYFNDYPEKFKQQIFGALQLNNLKFVELNYDVPKPNEKLNWGYINYLQMNDILLIPQFGIDEDIQAIEQLKKIFPGYEQDGKIEAVNIRKIIEIGGGGLNCISWNILI